MVQLNVNVPSECKESIKEYLANVKDMTISDFIDSAVLYALSNVEDFDKFLIEQGVVEETEEDEEDDESEEEDEDTEESEEEDEEED